MCSVLTGRAGNQNATELTRTQKEEPKAVLAQPPSQTGVHAEFWDVPALRDVVKILFDARHEPDSSCQLLLRFCGLSFKLPDPFDHRGRSRAGCWQRGPGRRGSGRRGRGPLEGLRGHRDRLFPPAGRVQWSV